MVYSNVSLICGIVAFLLISNGVFSRLLDSLSASINLIDDFVEEHSTDAVKKDAANRNSQAAAAQLPTEKSTLAGLAPAPAPAPTPASQLSETGDNYEGFFNKETFSTIWGDEMDNDDDAADANPVSDPAFEPNGLDDDNTEDDEDLPSP